MKNCICCDVDNTLANLKHRLHFVTGDRPDWKSFFAEMDKDTPIEDVVHLTKCLWEAGECIVIVSARPEDYRDVTEDWLVKNGILYDRLYMRESGDYRKDSVVKTEILAQMNEDGYYPHLWIDDRKQVIDVIREQGVTVADIVGDSRETIRGVSPPSLWVMIGPSGSGKSTYISTRVMLGVWQQEWVVSSDKLRGEICGDWTDQTQNEKVFEVLHNLVRERLRIGLNTIVDATNIRNRDRRAIVDLVPNDVQIYYVVVDRPLDEKKKTGEWRNDVVIKGQTLIEKHHQTMKSNLKEILKGDGYTNVIVEDCCVDCD